MEEKKSASRRVWIVILIGMLILIGVLVYALVKNHNVYTNYETVNTFSRSEETSMSYRTMREGMLKYSKDGVTMLDKSGNILWNQTFELSLPIEADYGDYIAVGDMGASDIYIYNQKGPLGHVTCDIPIQELKISSQGVVVAVLSDTEINYINLYDKTGELLIGIKATLENTGFPLAVGISSDAKKMVVSYFCLENAGIRSRMVFYDFSDTQRNPVMHEEVFEGLYPEIAFLDDTRVALFGENSFSLYAFDTEVHQVQMTEFDTEIRSVFHGSRRMGVIFDDAASPGLRHMELYDLSGKLTNRIDFSFDYTDIVTDDEQIILYNEYEIMAYLYSGKLKFHGSTDFAVNGAFSSWENGNYWLIGDRYLNEIHIK